MQPTHPENGYRCEQLLPRAHLRTVLPPHSFPCPEPSAEPGHLLVRAREVVTKVDWSSLGNVWVGAQPVTSDGVPVIGRTRLSSIYVFG